MPGSSRRWLDPDQLKEFEFEEATLDAIDAATIAGEGILPLRLEARTRTLTVGILPNTSLDAVRAMESKHQLTADVFWIAPAHFQSLVRKHFVPHWQSRGEEAPAALVETDKVKLRPDAKVITKKEREAARAAGEPREDSTIRMDRRGGDPFGATGPIAGGTRAGRAAAPAEVPAPEDRPARKPQVVAIVEPDAGVRAHLSALLEHTGAYPVVVGERSGFERALRVHDVNLAVLTRGCGVEPLDARELLDAAGRTEAEVRVVHDYAAALFGDLVEYDRMLAFTADLIEQLERAVSSAAGGEPGRTRRAGRLSKIVAERMRYPRRVVDAAFLAGMIVGLDPALARLRARVTEGAADAGAIGGGSGMAQALLERTAAPLGLPSILAALAAQPRSATSDAPAVRVVRAVRAYVDASESADGPSAEATLRARAGVDLDPDTVEAVLAVAASENALDKLGSDRPEIVLVDASPAATTLLELRLANRGYYVRTFRDGKKALSAIQARPPALVVAEVATPSLDGYTLLLKVRAGASTRATPFVFLTDRSDPASVTKAIELGADDYFQKPVNPDIFFAKTSALVAKAQARAAPAQGIQGRLEEMPLPDLLQVLAGAGRTVRLVLESMQKHATLGLVEGRLIHATSGRLAGDEAVIDVLLWQKGRFEIVRTERGGVEQNVKESLDFLIFEAARRQDEAKRKAALAGPEDKLDVL